MANKVHAVGIIIENEIGEILLLKRHKNDPEGETWGLVGGKVDEGELAVDAAIREAQEEIGLEIEKDLIVFVKEFHWDRSDLDIVFEVFKYNLKEVREPLILPENEITDILWITPEYAKKRTDLMQGLYPILNELF